MEEISVISITYEIYKKLIGLNTVIDKKYRFTLSETDKLTRLKAQLKRAGKDRLFTCLPSNISCDNNRAERDLRALVLKRKRSFGSKTIEGAKALATVLSICTNVWRENPTSYFKTLATISR